MLFRLIILIVAATCATALLWPLERLYTYGIVIVVAVILHQLPYLRTFTPKQFTPGPRSNEKPQEPNKVVDLDDFRRKKQKAEKKSEFKTKQ